MSHLERIAMEMFLLVLGIMLGFPGGMLAFMLIHEYRETVAWLRQMPFLFKKRQHAEESEKR